MAALDQHFYHKSIRTYTAAFGTIFNNMYLVRKDGQKIKIPVSYSSRQKFDITKKYEEDEAHYKVKFPRIGFVMTGWQRDTDRMQNRQDYLYQNIDKEITNSGNKQLNRVPYTFNYQVTVGTKNLDDMFQVMEQIAAWFNPSLNIEISENPDLGIKTSLNVKMTDSNLTDDYQGSMEDEKLLVSTFDFELEGFLYLPSGNQGIIETVCINYYDLNTGIRWDDESGCFPEPPQMEAATCADDLSPMCPLVSEYHSTWDGSITFIELFNESGNMGVFK